MSTIAVANIIFESTGNNYFKYLASNTVQFAAAGANVMVANATYTFFTAANSTSNTVVDTGGVTVQNSAFASYLLPYGYYNGPTSLTYGGLSVGNSTVNATVNATVIATSSNTFTLGSSAIAANGYSRLPNGLLMQWGTQAASVNATTTATATFTTTFATLYSVSLNGNFAAQTAVQTASNTTTVTWRNYSAAAAASNTVNYVAIGI